jgi:hypothetical protein
MSRQRFTIGFSGQIKSVAAGRMARAIMGMDEKPRPRNYRTLTSQEMGLARKMARDPKCTIEQIAAALNWELSLPSLRSKLRQVNIRLARVNVTGFLSLTHLRSIETRR